MMDELPLDPSERHARRLIAFSRWLTTTLDAEPAIRDSIVSLARGIDAATACRADQRANLTLLGEYLDDEIGRQYQPHNER